jgi:hypothetical protein
MFVGRDSEEAQERIEPLGGLTGGKKETPREGKAHEGRGPGPGLNRLSEVRTLAGSKALKRGPCSGALLRQGRPGKGVAP